MKFKELHKPGGNCLLFFCWRKNHREWKLLRLWMVKIWGMTELQHMQWPTTVKFQIHPQFIVQIIHWWAHRHSSPSHLLWLSVYQKSTTACEFSFNKRNYVSTESSYLMLGQECFEHFTVHKMVKYSDPLYMHIWQRLQLGVFWVSLGPDCFLVFRSGHWLGHSEIVQKPLQHCLGCMLQVIWGHVQIFFQGPLWMGLHSSFPQFWPVSSS